LLHRKALRVKSADFAKSGSLFQSFPRAVLLRAYISGTIDLANRMFDDGESTGYGSQSEPSFLRYKAALHGDQYRTFRKFTR
ncbi:hypothetical protein QK336_30985, partial [Pseudomonas aeruginosa]|nr:hypothetical protein [Pseudomonas aeruginosa]